MIVDVFIGVFDFPKDDKLQQERKQVVKAWQAYGEQIRLRVVTPMREEMGPMDVAEYMGVEGNQVMILGGLPLSEFQRGRRIMAETLAESEVYVVADSDCLPIGPNFVSEGVRVIMEDSYDFEILVPTVTNATINKWTPAADQDDGGGFGYEAVDNDLVMEHVDVGGIRFTLKGHMPQEMDQWAEQPDNRRNPDRESGWKYDRLHAEQVRRTGGRVGIIKTISYRHLGEGRYS